MAQAKTVSLLSPTRKPLASPESAQRLQFAQQLMSSGSDTSPILSDWQGANRVAQSLVGAMIARQQLDADKERQTKQNATLAQALRASEPWKSPDDVYRESDYLPGPRAEGYELKPGAEPVSRAGQPVPGTGGSQAMMDVLASNPDTAALALQMRAAEIQNKQSLADRIALARAGKLGDTRTVQIDDQNVTQEFGPNGWTNIGTGPKFAPRTMTPLDQIKYNTLSQMGPEERKNWLMKPSVSLDMTGKVMEKVLTNRLKKIDDRVEQWADLEPRLETIALLLESGNVDSGALEEVLLPVREWAKSFGWTVDKNLPQTEQVASAMKFLAPRMRVVGSGPSSDSDMRNFAKAAPRMANSTEGNVILARSMLQIHRRNKAARDLAYQFIEDHNNLIGFDEFAEKQLGPVFPQPKNAEEYNAMVASGQLSPGTVYYHPEAKRFVVFRGEQ